MGHKFRCGDIVQERDGRHTGEVRSTSRAGRALTLHVKLKNGWRQSIPAEDAVLVKAAGYAEPLAARWRPATVVKSPRQRLEEWMARQRAGRAK